MGPLDGIRVLDLTTVVMGPFATQVLADWGAEVITVDDGDTDAVRHMGPSVAAGLTGISLNLLRNKRSICLDLKTPEGRDIGRSLARGADVVVTNLRPGPLARLGLSYDELVQDHPRLIFCHAQGWSLDSGLSDRPAYDDIMQVAVGLPFLQQTVTGEATLMPTILVDKVCGLTIANAVMAALFSRERSGVGQRIEVPMFDTALAFTLVEHLAAATTNGSAGYSRILTPNRRIHQTSDGWMLVFPYTSNHWRALCEFSDRSMLADDVRFSTPGARIANADAMYGLVGEMLAERPTAEWVEFCTRADLPHQVAHPLNEIVADPTLHHGVLRPQTHPVAGPYAHIVSPVRFSKTPISTSVQPAPQPGQQTDEILAGLGFTETQVAELRRSGVVS